MFYRILAVGWLAGLSFLLGASARAEQQANRIAITPQSTKAAIIIKAPLLPIPPTYKTSYRLVLRTYDPQTELIVEGGYAGGKTITVEAHPRYFNDGFLVIEIKPGTYVVQSFTRQDLWQLCYHANSVQFNIAAGEVLYLGDFDATKATVELERLAVNSHRTISNGGPIIFFDNVSGPPLKTDALSLVAAAKMTEEFMPATTVTPREAKLFPARFSTGNSLFGVQAFCAGKP